MRSPLLALAFVGVAGVVGAAEEWQLSLTPYLLLPGVDATFSLDSPDGDPGVDSGPSDVLSLINMVAMLKVEARHERAFVFVDWMYLDMGNVDSFVRAVNFPDGSVPVGVSVTLDSDASFDGFMVMAGGGWRVVDHPVGTLDLYGGVRTLNLSASLRWSLSTTITSPGGSHTFPLAGEVEGGSETWDAVFGARGSLPLGEHWRVFGFGDYGWGHYSSSWQWALGLGRQVGSTSVELAWREIAWQGLGDEGNGDLKLFGPAIGATFRF